MRTACAVFVLILASCNILQFARSIPLSSSSLHAAVSGDEPAENLVHNTNPLVNSFDPTSFEPTWVDWGAPSTASSVRFMSKAGKGPTSVEPPDTFVPVPKNLSSDPSAGCLEAPFAVCVGSPELLGPTTISADSLPKGIAGWWDFDDEAGLDKSGRMNYVVPRVGSGPGFMGFGSSAHFNGSALHYIEHKPPYSSDELSITFWIYLIEEPPQGFTTILYKGSKTRFCPSIQLWPESRKLKIRVSTGRVRATSIDTVASIPVGRWTHIAYVAQLEVVRIFINGILDSKVVLPGLPLPNKDPIFLANDPWHTGSRVYIDDLRIYSRRVQDDEIEAAGDLAFPGIGSGAVRLGCVMCKINPAFLSCPNHYHVCSNDELETTAFQVARIMGWFSMQNMPYIWRKDDTDVDGRYGTALCCRDH